MMCDLLGIEPRPNNGTMATVKKMYKDEPDDEPDGEKPTAGQWSVITWSSRALVAASAVAVMMVL